jgi:hypothetical protein
MIARNLASSLAALAYLTLAAQAHAGVISANPSNYRTLLNNLQPGDTLQLAAGTYTQGLPLDNKAGTASAPIIIRGPDDQSAVFQAQDCCNTVQLRDTSYVQVLNLTLDGLGKDGPFGVDSSGNSHDITLENLMIVNHNGSQQTVGISTKGPAWNFVIRRNTIIGAGTGIYLGNSDGSQPFVAGVIEYNVILDTTGYNMEIKHQNPRPTGIGLPTGASRTIIRHNVFAKRSSTVGSDGARPNLLVGHFPLTGTGANDLYEIYGNFFYQNPTEALFQGEGNIALHDNVFVNSAGDAVNIQAHEDKPRTVTVYHNTVVATGNGLHISGADTNFVQKLIGNVAFAGDPIVGPNQQSNITGTYAQAATHLNAPTAAIGSLDLYPKAGQLTGAALDLSAFSGFTDGTKDFNGIARTGTHRGAYEGDGTNPGWKLALAPKSAVGGSTPQPAITMSADPAQVSLQGSTTLQWTATDATSCTASGGWSGAKSVSGSETVGPLAANTTFTMTCTGAGGSTAQSATVTIAAATSTTVTISASPMSINAGETALLSWTSTNAAGCTASNGWSGSKAPNGTQTVGPLQSSATFQLDCFGADQASATVTVTVGTGGGSTPNPPATPPTTPPPSDPPTTPTNPPSTPSSSSGGGGGSLDLSVLAVLTLLACAVAPARVATRRRRAG